MLVDKPVLVSDISPTFIVLKKQVVIGQFSFSPFFIDHHLGSKFYGTN